ncbi:hypothetical protein BLOT_011754 [Blomia tropicalis]|nr:hypothetical protein BLOT_011754 [Blomia tropicalis]
MNKAKKNLEPLQRVLNADCIANGGNDLNGRFHPMSNFLNNFMQPEELRYKELGELPENVVAVDCLVRKIPEQSFDLPKQLQDLPGKLVFFSMGSFGCANLPMMKRLVDILSRSSHRFIVSKGSLEYDLPGKNLYGEPFLPQVAILPMVALVITHGGNNTVTDTFYYGKPMMVMPMFCDQFDNAQRIAEVGLGARLSPFTCTEHELLSTIDKLLDDTQLKKRMEQTGERIRSSNDKRKVSDIIEAKLCK